MMAPIWAMNHSGLLKPMMLTQSCGFRPNDMYAEAARFESARYSAQVHATHLPSRSTLRASSFACALQAFSNITGTVVGSIAATPSLASLMVASALGSVTQTVSPSLYFE
jgi:hypothetical protein